MLPLLLPIFLQAAPTPATETSALPSPTATGTKPAGETHRAPSGRVLRLDDAIRVSIKAQPLMHEAFAQTAAAEGQQETARAGLLPQINGSAILERSDATTAVSSSSTVSGQAGNAGATGPTGPTGGTTGGTTGTAIPSQTNAYNLFTMGVTGSQLLYDFNQTPDRFRASKRNTESLKASERATELTVLLNVRTAFFTARADKALVYVADETLRNEDKHVIQVRGFVAAGTQPEIALATELTNLGNDRVALINAQNNYEIAKAQLNQSMGVVGDTNYDVAEEGLAVVAGEAGPDEELIDRALKARPEIVAYEKLRESDALTVTSLKGGYGPTLSAIGQVGATDYNVFNNGSSLNGYWTIGASLAWPLFQGGSTTGQVRTAQANYDYVNAELEAEKLQVRFQVQQAVLTVRAAKAQIDAANEALVNAREQLRLAEGRYNSGVGSIIELGDAQIAATAAAAQVVQADFNLSTARAQLLSALGKP